MTKQAIEIRKLILRCWTGGGGIPDPPDWGDIGNMPIYEGEGGEGGWYIMNNEFYVRGVGGNELAIYNHDQLEQWNVYGTDNVGKITKEDTEEFNFYYLKDHLGSIRAVINEDNEVVNAQDYDMWGFLLENRSFGGERYKFTGKERDDESSYDYFGARYYVSRIGRFGGLDPINEDKYSFSPYIYSGNNPLAFIDVDGMDWYFILNGDPEPFRNIPMEGSDKYFFQHSKGNLTLEASGDYLKMAQDQDLMGLYYFEAFSEVSVSWYFEYNKSYSTSDVILNFQDEIFWNLLKDQYPIKSLFDLDKIYDYYIDPFGKYYNLIPMSKPGGSFDYKKYLNEKKLYLLENKLLNVQEAGNTMWAATMYLLGHSVFTTRTAAHMFSLLKWKRLDEANEQRAIKFGYDFIEKE